MRGLHISKYYMISQIEHKGGAHHKFHHYMVSLKSNILLHLKAPEELLVRVHKKFY